MIMDENTGILYVADFNDNAIVAIRPDRTVEEYWHVSGLRWISRRTGSAGGADYLERKNYCKLFRSGNG